jgi:hypothetical protein
MKMSIKTATVFIFIILAGISCKKEDIDLNKISSTVNWDPKLAAPIGYGSYTFKDLIESQDSAGLIKVDANNLLYLTYRTELFSKIAEELVTIPNQSFSTNIQASDPGFPVFGANTTINYGFDSNFSFLFSSGEEIDSIFIKSGFLAFNITSTFHNMGSIRITLPTLKLNGVPKQIDITINKDDGSFYYVMTPQDLSGYKLYFDKSGGTPNKIPYSVNLTLNKSLIPVSPAIDHISFTTQFQSFKFKHIFGYIPEIDNLLSFSDKIELDLFNLAKKDTIDFNNPKLNIFIKNSFGIPVQLDLTNIRAYSEITGYSDVYLNPSNKIVRYPSITEIGQTKFDTIRYNKTNSGILDALLKTPKYLYYTIGTTVNPASLGKVYNFASDSSKFGVDLEVELPLDMRTRRFEVMDTIDFDLSDVINDFTILKKLVLHSTFENGMPFNLSCQLYLTDNAYNKIDSVFTNDQQPVIASGAVDSNGKVTTPTTKNVPVEFTGTRINKFENVRKAILKVKLSTTNNNGTYPYVKFYATDRMKVWFGIQADFEINSLDQL